MLSVTSRDGYEFIEHPALVPLRRLPVPAADGSEYFYPRDCANLRDHIHASVVWITPSRGNDPVAVTSFARQ